MERKLTITGKAKISAKPDTCILSFDILGHEWEYEASMKTLDEKVNSLRKVLKENGIKKEELKTIDFDVSRGQTYDDKKKKYIFNGYKATHRMKLQLPLDNKLLNKLLTQISKELDSVGFDISFGVKNSSKYEKELIQSAIKNAKEAAQTICESAEVELKEILNIDYAFQEIYINSHSNRLYSDDMMMENSLAPDFEPEDIDVRDTINVTWRIE